MGETLEGERKSECPSLSSSSPYAFSATSGKLAVANLRNRAYDVTCNKGKPWEHRLTTGCESTAHPCDWPACDLSSCGCLIHALLTSPTSAGDNRPCSPMIRRKVKSWTGWRQQAMTVAGSDAGPVDHDCFTRGFWQAAPCPDHSIGPLQFTSFDYGIAGHERPSRHTAIPGEGFAIVSKRLASSVGSHDRQGHDDRARQVGRAYRRT